MAILIVDLSNLTHAAKFAVLKGGGHFSAPLVMHKVISDIAYAADKFSATGILVACDAPGNWRRGVYPEYKGNRSPDEHVVSMKSVFVTLKEFFNTCTAIPAITVDNAEADDVISFAVKTTKEKCIILSSDKDFIQLISPRVRLYSPTLKEERLSTNPKFDLFVKCIRGDAGDNIFSAFPRVRSVRLAAAWDDPVDFINIMETVRPDGQLVKDVFEFNKQLIDLSLQPAHIKDSINLALNTAMGHSASYNQLKTLKFLGTNGLKTLIPVINKNAKFLSAACVCENIPVQPEPAVVEKSKHFILSDVVR